MPLRLGTRGSALAVAQSTIVARSLEQLGADVELVTITTSGDESTPKPDTEDKARFVKELERALLAEEIDLAVHSAKDVPGELPEGLEIVAVPERADPRDTLCLASSLAAADPTPDGLATRALTALPNGATVGTASLRRRAQLLALRPDLELHDLRGNVDTRLRRLEEGRYDAIVLAAAGLERLDLSAAGRPLPLGALTPAPGQGCLALEARTGDEPVRKLASRLTDFRAFARLTAERVLVAAIGASCHTPVGAHATIENHTIIVLRTFVGTPDGATWIRDEVRGLADDPQSVGAAGAERLLASGAREILALRR